MCCSDNLHCCPNGYTCDVAEGTCNRDAHSISWNAVAVRDIDKPSSNDVKCDHSEQSCPDGNTCCKLESGDYGCCPYDKVVITSHTQTSSFIPVVVYSILNPSTVYT